MHLCYWCWLPLVFCRMAVLSCITRCWSHLEKASCLISKDCDSSHWKILPSSFFFRTWRQRTLTPPLLLTTLCWCLTMKGAAPKLLVWAPWTPQSQTRTRTMTTWTNGAIASRSWRTCTAAVRTTRGLEANGEGEGSSSHVVENAGGIMVFQRPSLEMSFRGRETARWCS